MWSLKNRTDNKENVVGLDSAGIFWDLFETGERQKILRITTTDKKEELVSSNKDGIFWDLFETSEIQKLWSLNTTEN